MISPTSKTVMAEPEAGIPNAGDDPMTGDQADLLRALCEEAGEPYNAGLTEREALARIEELRNTLNTEQNL